jgi:hypothetical protein
MARTGQRDLRRRAHLAARTLATTFAACGAVALFIACSSSDSPPSVSGDGGLVPLGGGDAGPLVFDTSAAVTGPQDSHCGSTVQTTSQADCHPEGGGGGIVTPGGGYGATMYDSSGSDDLCKYDVSWTSTTITENKNVYFQIKATNRTDQSPVTGAAPFAEIFRLVDGNPGPSSNGNQAPTETSPGTYVIGPVEFDEPSDGGTPATQGYWTIRFHLFETCADVLPDSPHGHAAFYLNVP